MMCYPTMLHILFVIVFIFFEFVSLIIFCFGVSSDHNLGGMWYLFTSFERDWDCYFHVAYLRVCVCFFLGGGGGGGTFGGSQNGPRKQGLCALPCVLLPIHPSLRPSAQPTFCARVFSELYNWFFLILSWC